MFEGYTQGNQKLFMTGHSKHNSQHYYLITYMSDLQYCYSAYRLNVILYTCYSFIIIPALYLLLLLLTECYTLWVFAWMANNLCLLISRMIFCCGINHTLLFITCFYLHVCSDYLILSENVNRCFRRNYYCLFSSQAPTSF